MQLAATVLALEDWPAGHVHVDAERLSDLADQREAIGWALNHRDTRLTGLDREAVLCAVVTATCSFIRPHLRSRHLLIRWAAVRTSMRR